MSDFYTDDGDFKNYFIERVFILKYNFNHFFIEIWEKRIKRSQEVDIK